MATATHMKCRNYAPVDVVKGICHRTKGTVIADEMACDAFEAKPVCGRCVHYVESGREYLGKCTAEKGDPMTYPDLSAVTCPDFRAKD